MIGDTPMKDPLTGEDSKQVARWTSLPVVASTSLKPGEVRFFPLDNNGGGVVVVGAGPGVTEARPRAKSEAEQQAELIRMEQAVLLKEADKRMADRKKDIAEKFAAVKAEA